MRNLVYITGSGRSGSTLLDMLLSTHPDVAALGEVHRFSINLRNEDTPFRCTCGETLLNCKFWRAVLDKLVKDGIDPYNLLTTWSKYNNIEQNTEGTNIVEDIPPKALFSKLDLFNIFLTLGLSGIIKSTAPFIKRFHEGINIAENSWLLYEKICEAHNLNVTVDGTKSPGRLLSLMTFNNKQIPVKVIYLCRDGRAVTHARMNRQGLSMDYCVKAWVAEHKKISLALKHYAGQPLILKYEDLCTRTTEEMSRIFDYIQVHGDSDYSLFRESSHSLGGNPMRLRKSENTIRLNEKWKSELSKDNLKTFELKGGRLNKRLGYN
ncbi:MAG: sulfotransferase [Candidatus Thiodiazotropha sp. (ex Monitilora ramsayi)]|nr:sulfotransferase [Candidatus Thiodiazotropha sp. (ex Monitilora ramsayi)]